MITLGVDVGSLFSKAVVLRGEEMVASEISETTGNVARELDGLIAAVLEKAGLRREDVEACVSTGNGRDLVGTADFDQDDVSCLAVAARHFLPEVAVAIDIGGQSIAMVLSDAEGYVLDFMRNDKCASGSGRYLEVMSRALGVEVDRIDEVAERAERRVPISSQCGVFAESEIVSHVNRGEPVPGIVAGLCDSVASTVISQALRFGVSGGYTITGGVARIAGVTGIMRERMRGKYQPLPIDPMLAAAYGAALLAGMEEEAGP